MLSKQTTKLIIVSDDKTKEYANYLRQLISVKDDKEDEIVGTKDSAVDAIVWNEEQYNDNSMQISSNEHVLFIGENKTSKSEIASMQSKFNKFGMQYAWLGKRAMLNVENSILEESEYNNFINYCGTYKQYFNKEDLSETEIETNSTDLITKAEDLKPVKHKSENVVINKISKAASFVADKIIEPAYSVVEAGAKGAYKGIKSLSMRKKIMDQQYRALIVIFYLDDLNNFLED